MRRLMEWVFGTCQHQSSYHWQDLGAICEGMETLKWEFGTLWLCSEVPDWLACSSWGAYHWYKAVLLQLRWNPLRNWMMWSILKTDIIVVGWQHVWIQDWGGKVFEMSWSCPDRTPIPYAGTSLLNGAGFPAEGTVITWWKRRKCQVLVSANISSTINVLINAQGVY